MWQAIFSVAERKEGEMKNKSLFGIMLTMFLVLTLFSGLPVKAQWEDGVIKIGAVGPMAWIQGQGVSEGTQLAADQINAGPDGNLAATADNGIWVGAKQYKVEIVTADTLRGMPDPTGTTGAAAASDLVSAGVNFVVGGFRTEACLGLREVLMDYKKIWIIAGAATNELIDCVDDPTCGKCVRCDYDRYKYCFRGTPVNSTELFKAIAGYLKWLMIAKLMPLYTWGAPYPSADEDTPLKVAVITEALTWADVIDQYLTSEMFWNYPAIYGCMDMNGAHPVSGFKMGGVDIVYNARVSPVTTDVSAELAGVKASGARLLIDVISGPSGRTLAKQWADMEVNAFLVGIDVPGQEFPLHWTATAGKCETETFLVTCGSRTPCNLRTTAYYDVYNAKYDHAPIYTSYGAYDAVIALEQMLELGPDGTDGNADDPDWWDPSQSVEGLIPYMEAGVRDGSKPVWDYCMGTTYANLAITSRFKYTGIHPMGTAAYDAIISHGTTSYLDINPTMQGTLHDIHSGPLNSSYIPGQDEAHGPFWFEQWTRSLLGQWQEKEGAGSLEVVFPLNPTYATKTKIPEIMYPLAETDLYTDGVISSLDLYMILLTWQSKAGETAWIANGAFTGLNADMNYDKKITIADAGVVAKVYGQNSTDYGLPWPLPQ